QVDRLDEIVERGGTGGQDVHGGFFLLEFRMNRHELDAIDSRETERDGAENRVTLFLIPLQIISSFHRIDEMIYLVVFAAFMRRQMFHLPAKCSSRPESSRLPGGPGP